MPAQRRQQYEVTEEESQEAHDEEQPEDVNGFERSPSSSEEEKDEFIIVKLTEIRKEVQCPICLGIIRKTRTVMECLHRFCRECIDKSMRLGNNECPACRTHCASRRSLRDDPNYDALIAALYPDIDKYEEEELAFQEEEKARNKQVLKLTEHEITSLLSACNPAHVLSIQASIAQTIRQQTEALGKKKQLARSGTATARRSKRRKNYRAAESLGLDESEDLNANEGVKDSSSADEPSTDNKPKRSKRLGGARFSLPSSAGTTADGGGDENDTEVNRESLSIPVGFAGSSERLAWGKGGMRSHTRYGSGSAGNGKNARSIRISKLVDYFRNLDENDIEFDINLTLVSFDEQTIPTLARPHLSCRTNLSVADLCRYVAYQTRMQPDEVELLMGEEMGQGHKLESSNHASTSVSNLVVLKPCHGKLQVLNEHETLGKLQASCNSGRSLLQLAYRPKLSA